MVIFFNNKNLFWFEIFVTFISFITHNPILPQVNDRKKTQSSISCKYTLNFISSLSGNKILVYSSILFLTESIKPLCFDHSANPGSGYTCVPPTHFKSIKDYLHHFSVYSGHCQARGMWRIFYFQGYLGGLAADWSDWPLLQLSHLESWEQTRYRQEDGNCIRQRASTLSLRTEEVGRQRQNILIVNAHVMSISSHL